MAYKTVELIIRMLTDEEFRDRFLANPVDMPLSEMGYDLTRGDIEASLDFDRQVWGVESDWIDANAALWVRACQWLTRTDPDHEG
jgi:hypothetical protein